MFHNSVVTGTRAVIPDKGFPTDGSSFELELKDGRKIPTNLVIPATGQTPNNQFLQDLQPTPGHEILNQTNGFIKVSPTLQFADPAYSNLYACGDIADSGAHKAARPGAAQAAVVAQNIAAMVQGGSPTNKITVDPPAIHLSLGLVSIALTEEREIAVADIENRQRTWCSEILLKASPSPWLFGEMSK